MSLSKAISSFILAVASVATWPQFAAAQDITKPNPIDQVQMQACFDVMNDKAQLEQTLVLSHLNCVGTIARACQMEGEENQTTLGMTQCIQRETAFWDDLLNANYQQLADTLYENEFAALKEAQRSWIKFRDASCDFTNEFWQGGTIRYVTYSNCIMEETAKQAIQLQNYLSWLDR